jgi:2'-5' RNA ligase
MLKIPGGTEMPNFLRSFLAFDIETGTVLDRLAAAQKLLVQTGAHLKLVEPQNIHITIRFLGNIAPKMIEKIFEEMKQVKFAPFKVQLKGLGAFPNPNYARVIWTGITAGADQLKNVFSQLEPHLRDLGFTPASKGFNPHLTIARVRSGRNKVQLSQLITEKAAYEFGDVNAKCLRLKKSDLTPRGPVYSTLKEFCP